MTTRLWETGNPDGGTAIQYNNEATPKVWMHTNIGWIPIGNAPEEDKAAEEFAEETAKGYELTESSQSRAKYMAGIED